MKMFLPEIEKRTTINISYQMSGHSFYAELHGLNEEKSKEIGLKAMSVLEELCKQELDSIKKK
jgi:hypothetical protein